MERAGSTGDDDAYWGGELDVCGAEDYGCDEGEEASG